MSSLKICKNCKFWRPKKIEHHPNSHNPWGSCDLIIDGSGRFEIYRNLGISDDDWRDSDSCELITTGDFGCNQFEEKKQ